MRGFAPLTRALALSQLREPVGFFFLVIFSPALLLLLGAIFGNEPAPEFGGRGPVDNMVPGIMIMSLLIIGATVIPQTQALLRTSGALTRLRMTPLNPATYMASDMTVNFAIGIIGPIITLIVALLVFGVNAPQNPLALLGAITLVMVSMLALGYVLAAAVPSVGAANGVGNILMILLMITSGAFIPVASLPPATQRIFEFSPSFHMSRLVQASWEGAAWPGVSVAVVAGLAVVFGVLAVVLMRRVK